MHQKIKFGLLCVKHWADKMQLFRNVPIRLPGNSFLIKTTADILIFWIICRKRLLQVWRDWSHGEGLHWRSCRQPTAGEVHSERRQHPAGRRWLQVRFVFIRLPFHSFPAAFCIVTFGILEWNWMKILLSISYVLLNCTLLWAFH